MNIELSNDEIWLTIVSIKKYRRELQSDVDRFNRWEFPEDWQKLKQEYKEIAKIAQGLIPRLQVNCPDGFDTPFRSSDVAMMKEWAAKKVGTA